MKGDPKVMAGLQEAINLETSIYLQYFLDACDAQRFGLSIADGLKKLACQSQEFARDLTARLLFLEGSPVVAPDPANTHDNVTAVIVGAISAETAIITRYTQLCRDAWEAGDLSNFHFYQHLDKWHRQGGNDYDGHLSWLQKQQWQLKQLGEKDYIAEKI
jgi:bacterioferritin (cytochrome b1)